MRAVIDTRRLLVDATSCKYLLNRVMYSDFVVQALRVRSDFGGLYSTSNWNARDGAESYRVRLPGAWAQLSTRSRRNGQLNV